MTLNELTFKYFENLHAQDRLLKRNALDFCQHKISRIDKLRNNDASKATNLAQVAGAGGGRSGVRSPDENKLLPERDQHDPDAAERLLAKSRPAKHDVME